MVNNTDTQTKKSFGPLSHLAQTLIGSEIVKLGAEIKAKIKNGQETQNSDKIVFPFFFPSSALLNNPFDS